VCLRGSLDREWEFGDPSLTVPLVLDLSLRWVLTVDLLSCLILCNNGNTH